MVDHQLAARLMEGPPAVRQQPVIILTAPVVPGAREQAAHKVEPEAADQHRPLFRTPEQEEPRPLEDLPEGAEQSKGVGQANRREQLPTLWLPRTAMGQPALIH